MAAKRLLTVALLGAVSVSSFEERALEQGYENNPLKNNACAIFDYDKLSLREVGGRNTLDWRIWLELDEKPISFWHDVPLYPNESNKNIINFVVEIPRWTDGKIEIRRSEPLNPIFHDNKDGQPRYVESVWPHKSYPFLYGSIPQTWENPNLEHDFTGLAGDNDPMDLFDIGQDPGYTGQVKQVKVLGGLAVNDANETDWKILGIDVTDPLAALVNTHEDIEKYRPGTLQAFRDWFTYYKVARGDDMITIVGGTYQNVSFIVDKIEQSHGYWKDLVTEKEDANEINYNQTSNAEWKSYVSCKDATRKFGLPWMSRVEKPAQKPVKYEEWYYLDGEMKLIELPSA